eukprot:Tbor_TRINITY_DN5527_c0_g1::TRINITY_DN5527_c0_g1_i1::g.12827::m.12827
MNRAKQLEGLRSMKFMQRKEEAVRRQAIEANAENLRQLNDTANSIPSAISNTRCMPSSGISSSNTVTITTTSAGATIVYENSFDTSAHISGRRKFGGRTAGNDSTIVSTATTVPDSSGHVSINIGDLSLVGCGDNNNNNNDDADDTELWQKVAENDEPKDLKASQNQNRFTLKESVRAPVLPKRLLEEMRERQYNDNDNNVPRVANQNSHDISPEKSGKRGTMGGRRIE